MFNLKRENIFRIITSLLLVSFVVLLSQIECPLSEGTPDVKATKSDFSVAAVGDWGCNSNTQKTISSILKINPGLVIGLGDNSYQSTGSCWLNMIKPFNTKMRTSFGNHDATPELVNEYLTYFKLPKTYYSFDFENIHFITIDTNMPLDANSPQFNFVKNDLEKASPNMSIAWIIPFFHIPAYTTPSGERIETLNPTEHATITSFEALRDTYQPLFDKYGVKIVLQAHAHNYQRSYPITYNPKNPSSQIIADTNRQSYNNSIGEIYLTVGTGGRDLHAFVGSQPPYVVTEQDIVHGFLSLHFTGDGSIVVQFYENDQMKPIHEFTILK